MWPFRRKKDRELTLAEKIVNKIRASGHSDEECAVLERLERIFNYPDWLMWYFSKRSQNKRWCPYCSGIVIELCSAEKIKPLGSARDANVFRYFHFGFFCITCGVELLCGRRGCKYRAGDEKPPNKSHWSDTDGEHATFKIKKGKAARNLFDFLDEIETERLVTDTYDEVLGELTGLGKSDLDFQDEYAKLNERLDEMAGMRAELDEEEIRIHARMHEINLVFAQEVLAEIEPPKELMAAADGDREIVAEAEAEVERIAPDYPET